MINHIINQLRQGVPTEQVSAESGLSISDIEAVRNSPLVKLCLEVTDREEIE